MHLVYPPNLHNRCFQFLQGITVAPRKIEDGGYAKVQHGLGENNRFVTLLHDRTGQLKLS